ncbi:MAG: protein translocase subunit SecD [Clostridia bacterium]
MKKLDGIKLAIALILIVALGFVAFQPLIQRISLGLDLQGGVHVVLKASATETAKVNTETMKQLQEVMRTRVDQLGVSEPLIQIEGTDRLIVELAGVQDPEKAVEVIGKTAKLTFVDSTGKVILSGTNLADAAARIESNGTNVVTLKFDKVGTAAFAAATATAAAATKGSPENKIAIMLDDKVITNPQVNTSIPNGEAVISGGFATFDEAASLAALLRAGALPLNTEIIEKRTVGPTLGSDSLTKSLFATELALLLIAIFMIIMYRLPGIIAVFSLVVFGVIVLGILVGIGAVLTLPSIAGMLLTVGMAADANIIIYERIKDELKAGKSVQASVKSGFKRAFTTVFDSNLTTVIAGVVLFYLGSGSIKGFALTLMIGIAINMITALLITRYLLYLSVQIPALRKASFFGVKGGKA